MADDVLIDPQPPESVLVVMAHPDDAEFSAGGTLARWSAAGTRIDYCIVTNGDKGTSDAGADPADVARLRTREQRAAADRLGVSDVLFLGHPDGVLEATVGVRREVVRAIRTVRPAALICPDPLRRYGPGYINHPDHIAAGELALAAVYPSARDPHVFPELLAEGLEPHKVLDVFLANPAEPNCAVDISTTMERKIEALMEHRSQVSEERLREFVPRRAADSGARFGLGPAELFLRITLP